MSRLAPLSSWVAAVRWGGLAGWLVVYRVYLLHIMTGQLSVTFSALWAPPTLENINNLPRYFTRNSLSCRVPDKHFDRMTPIHQCNPTNICVGIPVAPPVVAMFVSPFRSQLQVQDCQKPQPLLKKTDLIRILYNPSRLVVRVVRVFLMRIGFDEHHCQAGWVCSTKQRPSLRIEAGRQSSMWPLDSFPHHKRNGERV